jgi:hypothetical protein
LILGGPHNIVKKIVKYSIGGIPENSRKELDIIVETNKNHLGIEKGTNFIMRY